jgi:alcohol dehydrogenase/S-(hydroxymethyl)glutathione dehydrogenase/alcohol dehydrogenase
MQPAKGDLARRFGATDFVVAAPTAQETVQRAQELVPGGFTHTIEAVGRPQTATLAYELLAPGGTATILGLMPAGATLSFSADALVYGDRRIQGAYMGANRFLNDVAMFVDHYREGRLDLDSMVTDVIPFTEINEGLAAMSDPTTVRIVMDMTQGPA